MVEGQHFYHCSPNSNFCLHKGSFWYIWEPNKPRASTKTPQAAAEPGRGSPPEPRPQGTSSHGQAWSHLWGNLRVTSLNMGIRKDLHGCTPFDVLFYIATNQENEHHIAEAVGKGRQRAELLAEGHRVSVGKLNPEGPEEGRWEPFYWQREIWGL